MILEEARLMPQLDVQGVHCGYGKEEIIHGIDLHVERGEIVAILGPNGCGKTTLLKAVLGYVPVKRGRVVFEGRDLSRLNPTERSTSGLGYVPQLLNVFKPLTVHENLEMGGFRLNRAELGFRIERILSLFPVLGDRGSQKAGTLSGGERQLLAVARAMMVSPKLLCLDEPSAGLAPTRVSEVFAQIRTIAELGTSVVLVEQDVYRALEISSRAYVLVVGRVAFEGRADSIITDARLRVAYLGTRGAFAFPGGRHPSAHEDAQ
jgi:ABC-type branched-subunit amino acid transport system ATPase component